MNETYTEEIKCPNCKLRKLHNIPKGESIKDYSKKNKCVNCGCSLSYFELWRKGL